MNHRKVNMPQSRRRDTGVFQVEEERYKEPPYEIGSGKQNEIELIKNVNQVYLGEKRHTNQTAKNN